MRHSSRRLSSRSRSPCASEQACTRIQIHWLHVLRVRASKKRAAQERAARAAAARAAAIAEGEALAVEGRTRVDPEKRRVVKPPWAAGGNRCRRCICCDGPTCQEAGGEECVSALY